MNVSKVWKMNTGHGMLSVSSLRVNNNTEVEVKKELDDMFINVNNEGLIDSGQRSVFIEATCIDSDGTGDPLGHFIDDQMLPKLEIKEDVDDLYMENIGLPYVEEDGNFNTSVSILSRPSTSKCISIQEDVSSSMKSVGKPSGYKHQEKLLTDDRERELPEHHLKMTDQAYNLTCFDVQSLDLVKDEGLPSFAIDTTPQSSKIDDSVIDLHLKLLKDKFMCKLCNKRYTDFDKCKDHIRSHLGLKPFVCSYTNCNKSFSSKDSLRSHQYLIHKAHDRFKCKKCNRTFNKRNLFIEHCNKHDAIMPFDCAICGKAFPGKESIFLHIVDVHKFGDQTHLCPKCGKVFSNRSNFRCHLRTHGEKRFKCETCNSYFISRIKLSNHAASHSTERPFQCSLCSKSYRLKTTLHRHIAQTHEKKKNFKCSTCDKSFVSGSFLREHKLKHEGVRKYSCETCGKTFAQASHLGAHKFSHGEKKFVCSVCGAKFNRHDNMKSHVKRHETKKLK